MKRLVACIALLAMATGASAQDRDGPPEGGGADGGADGGLRRGAAYANPSALIAAEIALQRQAREKGQWQAYRENAAVGAVLLAPEPVPAEPWLKDRAEPAALPNWQPHAVWMSCDGGYGAVEGGWTEPGSSGLYAAIWQRQENGGYKWLIRQRIGRDRPVTAPDMLSASVADCEQRGREADNRQPLRARKGKPLPPAVNAQTGYSEDRTLYWRTGKDADGTPWLQVAIRKEGAMRIVLGDALGPLAGN